jgi:hypothetical protein
MQDSKRRVIIVGALGVMLMLLANPVGSFLQWLMSSPMTLLGNFYAALVFMASCLITFPMGYLVRREVQKSPTLLTFGLLYLLVAIIIGFTLLTMYAKTNSNYILMLAATPIMFGIYVGRTTNFEPMIVLIKCKISGLSTD